MHRQIAIVLLATLLALPVAAGRRRSVATVASDSLSIVFVDAGPDGGFTSAGGDAWLDVKDVARTAGNHSRGTRVQRRIGIRVVRTSGAVSGTAAITARLDSSDGRTSMRLDGKALTEAALLVDPHAAIGGVTFHTLEIEISDTIAAGPIAAAITWEVNSQ